MSVECWETIFQTRPWGEYPSEAVIRGFPATPRGARVLELGCGPGANLWYLSRQGYRVSGIDGSATAIDYALNRAPFSDLIIGDFTRPLDYPSEHFDAVLDSCALCCVDRVELLVLTLAEAWRVLKPGGKLLSIGFTPKTTRDLRNEVHIYLSRQDVLGVYGAFERHEIETYTRVDPKGVITENLIVTAYKPCSA